MSPFLNVGGRGLDCVRSILVIDARSIDAGYDFNADVRSRPMISGRRRSTEAELLKLRDCLGFILAAEGDAAKPVADSFKFLMLEDLVISDLQSAAPVTDCVFFNCLHASSS